MARGHVYHDHGSSQPLDKGKTNLKIGQRLNQELIMENYAMVNTKDFAGIRVNPYKIKGDHLCSIVEQEIEHTAPSKLEQGRRNIISSFVSNRESFIEGLIRTTNRKPKGTGNKIQTSLKLKKKKNYKDISTKLSEWSCVLGMV